MFNMCDDRNVDTNNNLINLMRRQEMSPLV